MTLQTVQRPVADLRPHPDNPNNGDIDAIALSLRTNGQYRPIVVTTDGTILAGNHTWMAAASLGWQDIAVVTLDVPPDSPDALRVMAADNRTAELGRTDDGLLHALLQRIDTLDSLVGTGYNESDLEALAHLAGAPDLDDLARDTGDFTPLDTYVTVTLRLPPDLADDLHNHLADNGGAEAAISALLHG